MYTISKSFDFSASHALTHLAADHKCRRNHGHNYQVSFTLERENPTRLGFVLDYAELDPIKQWIDVFLDHRNISDVLANDQAGPATAENLARYMFDRWSKAFPNLVAVTVRETARTTATYRP